MPIKSILLSIAALVCFAAAWRFGSHGFMLQDTQCIGLSGIAISVAALLLWFAFRNKVSRRDLPA